MRGRRFGSNRTPGVAVDQNKRPPCPSIGATGTGATQQAIRSIDPVGSDTRIGERGDVK